MYSSPGNYKKRKILISVPNLGRKTGQQKHRQTDRQTERESEGGVIKRNS
jgi:hypothetical protein